MIKRNKKKYELVDHKALWIMLIPVLIYFILFKYLPMAGVVIAFQRYSPFKGVLASDWVGLEYFRQFFSSIYFTRVLRNTLMIGLFDLLFGFPFPIILALLLNGLSNRHFKKLTQTITLLPHFVSFVVVAGIAINMLSPSTGVINALRLKLGLDSIYFLQEPKYFWGIFTVIKIIKESGFTAIIYLAALTTIDPTLYEAAICDGANRAQQLKYVTFPALIPTIVIMFIIKIGKIISISFEQILLLQNDVILSTSEVISTLVYRRGLVNADYSYATAVGLFETFVALVLVLSSNAIVRRIKNDSSLW
ncbi:MAG: ABC transporter permease subunit [Sphaerochaetaceae bacterium]|jgi:putative aldouronate transport system permease protein|nr:ABC transporter permease subunit [Sphaerochaetaceae bacterium]